MNHAIGVFYLKVPLYLLPLVTYITGTWCVTLYFGKVLLSLLAYKHSYLLYVLGLVCILMQSYGPGLVSCKVAWFSEHFNHHSLGWHVRRITLTFTRLTHYKHFLLCCSSWLMSCHRLIDRSESDLLRLK